MRNEITRSLLGLKPGDSPESFVARFRFAPDCSVFKGHFPAQPLLPAGTYWVAIEGGNHAGFGWYGDQDGDNPATISRGSQQNQVIQASIEFLDQMEHEIDE